ncbi:MAG TPA: hypothetical protein VFW68_12070 [Rhodocyclaceae bacterium]|nr:hypothetical protein [Rhodocyclaceae bacterium]
MSIERLPMQLPWLARRSGLSDAKAAALWQEAVHSTEKVCGNRDSSEFYGASMDKLRASMDAESHRLNTLSCVRPWSRLQRQVMTLQMSLLDTGSVMVARTARAWALPTRFC